MWRRNWGAARTTAPSTSSCRSRPYIHAAFSQWHQLSWLKAPHTLAELRKLRAASDDPAAMERLIDFIDLDLGFELYGAISEVKIRLSEAERTRFAFDTAGTRSKPM